MANKRIHPELRTFVKSELYVVKFDPCLSLMAANISQGRTVHFILKGHHLNTQVFCIRVFKLKFETLLTKQPKPKTFFCRLMARIVFLELICITLFCHLSALITPKYVLVCAVRRCATPAGHRLHWMLFLVGNKLSILAFNVGLCHTKNEGAEILNFLFVMFLVNIYLLF